MQSGGSEFSETGKAANALPATQEEEFWEGNALEYKERFFTNDDGIFCKTESENRFSGVIKYVPEKERSHILEQLYGGFDAWRFLRMA